MNKKMLGNPKNQAITTRTANSRKTQNFASSGRFRHDAHEIHITNLRQHAKNPKIREIFAQNLLTMKNSGGCFLDKLLKDFQNSRRSGA